MNKRRDNSPGEDEGIEELLRHVGARDEPSAEVMNEVQQAVHAQWQEMLAERAHRRRRVGYAAAASLAVIVVIAAATIRSLAPSQNLIATIARIDGSLQLAAASAELPAVARVGQRVSVGETLRTGAGARVALAFDDGLSVRIDAGSTVEFAAPNRLVLSSGAVYVDADPDRPVDDPLQIETRAGIVRHVGTQYQVRQEVRAVVISIREGQVTIAGAHGESGASAGEMLSISAGGSIERAAISPYDARWQWAIAAAPAFDIDNRLLSDFLDWVGRETGKRIVYASPQVLQVAQSVVLRGSIGSLDPESALATVLSTTDLRSFASTDDSIGIELALPANRR